MNPLIIIPFVLLYALLGIIIVVLIFKRVKNKKKENFEKRDN
jgi:predicted membrane protein